MNYKLKETDMVIGLDSDEFTLCRCYIEEPEGWKAKQYPPFDDTMNECYHSTTVKIRTIHSKLIGAMFE